MQKPVNIALKFDLLFLRDELAAPEISPEIIAIARVILNSHLRAEIPDWVEILANGDPFYLDAVIEIARADIRAEEMTE